MNPILIKPIIDALCGALNALGGFCFLAARRFIMPCVIAGSVSFYGHVWWLGVVCLPAMGTLCLGYFPGNWGRGLWLFIQAIALSLGCALLGHLSWFLFVTYIVGSGILGGIYKGWYQPVGDFITGFYLSLFIWFLH